MLNNEILKQYKDIETAYKALKKQLDTIKADIIQELQQGDCTVDEKGNLIFTFEASGSSAKLSIINTVNIDGDAVKAAFPGQFLKPGTRTSLSVKC